MQLETFGPKKARELSSGAWQFTPVSSCAVGGVYLNHAAGSSRLRQVAVVSAPLQGQGTVLL